MKNIILGLALIFATAGISVPAFGETSGQTFKAPQRAGSNDTSVEYYCPFPYRLVYTKYVTYQLVWTTAGYVYMPVVTYGYACVYP